jgi:hypothetical protein
MRIAEGGIDGWLRREVRKVDMMSSMLDVRDVGCEGSIPVLPIWVGIIDGKVV